MKNPRGSSGPPPGNSERNGGESPWPSRSAKRGRGKEFPQKGCWSSPVIGLYRVPQSRQVTKSAPPSGSSQMRVSTSSLPHVGQGAKAIVVIHLVFPPYIHLR